MALRNCDVDSVIRCLIEGGREDAEMLAGAAASKLKDVGVALNSEAAVRELPITPGRRNPLKPQQARPKGSADVNMRGILDWIDSIDGSDGDADPDGTMKSAREALVKVQATAAARCASA